MNNELLSQYHRYLIDNKKIGKVTTKNYLADIRKFINWYENTFARKFNPNQITKEIANDYLECQNPLLNTLQEKPSTNSLKRYGSSLKKFYAFLKETKHIHNDPFATALSNNIVINNDPWHLKEFRSYLYLSNSSKVTLKNYLVDIKQFIDWFEEVLLRHEMPLEPSLFSKLSNSVIEDYKSQLLHDAKLSPVSINRKLSALRKYFHWANEQAFLKESIQISSTPVEKIETNANNAILPASIEQPLSLMDLQTFEPEEELQNENTYSGFAPIRLIQKTTKLLLLPLDRAIDILGYSYWKASGRKVFASVAEIMGKKEQPAIEAVKTFSETNLLQTSKEFIKKAPLQVNIHSKLTKGFSQPLYISKKISTQNFSLSQKIFHHIRHTRPAWYHRYHSYQFVHYLHVGVLVLATMLIGYHVSTTLAEESHPQMELTASTSNAPPRTLAFTGKLNDNNNNPITAETSLRFAIYKSAANTDKNAIWSESDIIEPNQNGSFSTILGKQTPLSETIFRDYPSLYLGITIAGEKELEPRQVLANVTNATNANTLQGLKPITDPNAGVRNAILALDSTGNLTIGNAASPTFEATDGKFSLSGQVLTLKTNPGSNTNIQINPDGAGIIDLQKPIENTTNFGNNPSTAGAVEIDDSLAVYATESAHSAFTINQNGSGDIISASASGIAKFTVDQLGNGFFDGNIAMNGNTLNTSANSINLFTSNTSAINLGGSTSVVTTGNDLNVQGKLALPSLRTGAIPFIRDGGQVDEDIANLYWDDQNKRLGIGTTTPGSKLSIPELGTGAGTALVIDDNGNIYKASSSRRYKDNITPLTDNPLLILNASPVSFRYKDTGTYDIGFIAEDFDALGLKDLVIYDKDGKPDGIKYDRISIYLLGVIKQQQAAIKDLQDTTATIETGYQQVQQNINNSISNISQNITIGGQTMQEYIDSSIHTAMTTQSPTPTSTIIDPVATNSATPSPSQTPTITPAFIATQSGSLSNNLTASDSAAASNSGQITNSLTASESAILATPSATITPTSTLNEVSSPTTQTNTTGYANIASMSGQLSYVPNFKSDYATINQGLVALGPTSLTDVGISGQVSIGSNMQIDNNSINTLASDLSIQPLRQGNVNIMGGLVTIDTQGNLAVNGNAHFAHDVTIAGRLSTGFISPIPDQDLVIGLQDNSSLVVKSASGSSVLTVNQSGDLTSSGSGIFERIATKDFSLIRGAQADTSFTETVANGAAGTGVITANETERTIKTPSMSKNSLVYVTATSDTSQVTPYVARQTNDSFTIQIPKSITTDLSFNWWIVN